MAQKKIHIIGSVGLPANYGGWETLAENLVGHLSNEFEFTVYCSLKRHIIKQLSYKGAKLVYLRLDANGLQSIFYDLYSMVKSLRSSDIMLVLGVSGCVFLPIIKLFYKGKIIVNIDGLEWKRDKWSKLTKFFLKLSECVAVKYADIIVTDNKAIQDYVLKQYNSTSVLIAYGGDHADTGFEREVNKNKPNSSLSFFKVCRIEPENNIQLIIEAFAGNSENELTIVGNWDNSEYGKALRLKYFAHKNIKLLNAIYDLRELNELRCNTDIYLHGHSAGGTNPSLVEAMFLGLPIFAYDVSYNRETTLNSCQYFQTTKELEALIKEAAVNRHLIVKNAENMKNIAMKLYTWKAIAEKYSDAFSA